MELWTHCDKGEVEQVRRLLIRLRQYPSPSPRVIVANASANNIHVHEENNYGGEDDMDPNHRDRKYRETPLHRCCQGNRPEHLEIVTMLLAHPKIDCNPQNPHGWTPLWLAAANGWTEMVTLLLKDPRINVKLPSHKNETPFWIACFSGSKEVLGVLITRSLFPLNFKAKGWFWDSKTYFAWEVAALRRYPEVSQFVKEVFGIGENNEIRADRHDDDDDDYYNSIDKCQQIFNEKRFKLQLELGMQSELAGRGFILMVLLSDGYLALKSHDLHYHSINRFFRVAVKLPMDLQMRMSNCLFSVPAEWISAANTRDALNWFLANS